MAGGVFQWAYLRRSHSEGNTDKRMSPCKNVLTSVNKCERNELIVTLSCSNLSKRGCVIGGAERPAPKAAPSWRFETDWVRGGIVR